MSGARDTSALRIWKGISVRMASGLVALKAMQVRDSGNILRSVLVTLKATASPTYVRGAAASGGAPSVPTGSTTVTATGGSGNYTYAWASPDTGWSAISPSSATTAFRKAGVGVGASYTTTFTCTVTDASGATATATVQAYVENYGSPGFA